MPSYGNPLTTVAPLQNGGWPYPPIDPYTYHYPQARPPTFAQPPGGYGGPGYNILAPFPNSPQGFGLNRSEVGFDFAGECSCHDKKPSGWGFIDKLIPDFVKDTVSKIVPDEVEGAFEAATGITLKEDKVDGGTGITLKEDKVDGGTVRKDPAEQSTASTPPPAVSVTSLPPDKPPFYTQTWFIASVAGGVGIAAAAYLLGNMKRR